MIYDDFANRVTADYSLFLMAISGAYQSIVAPGIAVTPAVTKEFTLKAKRSGQTVLDIIESDVTDYFDTLYGNAQSAPDSAISAKQQLLKGMRKAVAENVSQLVKSLRTGAHNYRKTLSGIHGSMGQVLQKKLGVIEFKIFDTSNRRWGAASLVNVVARSFAYQLWLEETIFLLKDEGYRFAQVVYDDQTREKFVFSLYEQVGYLTFEDIRQKTFHINSTAKVIGYVQGE